MVDLVNFALFDWQCVRTIHVYNPNVRLAPSQLSWEQHPTQIHKSRIELTHTDWHKSLSFSLTSLSLSYQPSQTFTSKTHQHHHNATVAMLPTAFASHRIQNAALCTKPPQPTQHNANPHPPPRLIQILNAPRNIVKRLHDTTTTPLTTNIHADSQHIHDVRLLPSKPHRNRCRRSHHSISIATTCIRYVYRI